MSDETQLTVWRGVEAAAVLLVLGFFFSVSFAKNNVLTYELKNMCVQSANMQFVKLSR